MILQRLTTSEYGTFGVLMINNKPMFVTLEPPWRNNQKGVSCIPEGIYPSTYIYSDKFSKDVYILHNVAGRDAVEIHVGNKVKDTEGCILLGMSFSQHDYAIDFSQQAFNSFMSISPKEGFTLIIKDVIDYVHTSTITIPKQV